jgi:hypothetical protein
MVRIRNCLTTVQNLALKMGTVRFSETFVTSYESTRRQIPEQHHQYGSEYFLLENLRLAVTSKNNSSFFKMAVFWDVALCSLVKVDRRFRGACSLYHQGSTSETSVSFY